MHKLGIVVPYRDRYDQLQTFLKHTLPYLESTGLTYRVVIVEQDDAKAFNRGTLCNIGFKEVSKLHCDYVVFHDLDLLPIDVDYSYSEHPVHLASDILPFETYFGGITLFPSKDFEKINGFSNHYWGWGFEDDDLRLRCHKANIDYGIEKENKYNYDKPTLIFNGSTSYGEIENTIKTVRDFNIDLGLRLGDFVYSTTKQFDEYTIITIPGFDFKLTFTSFNRMYLSFFDKKGIHYDITSKILLARNYKITINYSARDKKVTFSINDETAGTVQLENKLYIDNDENIIIGTNKEKSNFFTGAIDYFKLTSGKANIIDFSSDYINKSKWVNKAETKVESFFKNVKPDYFKCADKTGNNIPHRRQSTIKRLIHEDQGYSNGVWKHKMTRWNQIRLNNGVLVNNDSNEHDGLNTCQYTVLDKNKNRKTTQIKVSI